MLAVRARVPVRGLFDSLKIQKKYKTLKTECARCTAAESELHCETLLALSDLALESDDAMEAQWLATQLSEKYSEDERVLDQLAKTKFWLGELGQSVDSLLKLEVLRPNDPSVSFNLAQAFYHLGELKQAKIHATNALQLRPNHQSTIVLMEQILEVIDAGKEATKHADGQPI